MDAVESLQLAPSVQHNCTTRSTTVADQSQLANSSHPRRVQLDLPSRDSPVVEDSWMSTGDVDRQLPRSPVYCNVGLADFSDYQPDGRTDRPLRNWHRRLEDRRLQELVSTSWGTTS